MQSVQTYPAYLELAVIDQQKMIDRAKKTLARIDFELFVARGISGAISAPLLAHAMGKRFLIVRKANDGSHSNLPYVGDVRPNDRWIFVDDFIMTGATLGAVKLVMKDFDVPLFGRPSNGYRLQHVGSYLYSTGLFNEDTFEPV